MSTLTEMERIAGFREVPREVIVAVPVELELFNKLYETCIREHVELKVKIRDILENALTN